MTEMIVSWPNLITLLTVVGIAVLFYLLQVLAERAARKRVL
ncbi:hypothetical protein [Rhizobium phage RHph_X2_25]|nr:hypothetical protein [Rhizobium phage RHph_X2_25]